MLVPNIDTSTHLFCTIILKLHTPKKMKTIQSPDGISLLMENLWLRHKTGTQQRPANVYLVELPPLSDEEMDEILSLIHI